MERSYTVLSIANSPASEEGVLEVGYREELIGDLSMVREQLAGDHAERSRRLVESATSAENIRHSSEEVTDYINGLATELYFRLTAEDGASKEEAIARVDVFIAEQTHLLLGDMAAKRSQAVTAHNRFIPKPLSELYDKALQKWRSWEVPTGDGKLVSLLRETATWQKLEQITESTNRNSKLGRFALTVATSSLNGVENLVKYSGARKRLAAMAGLGIISGATAGALLGAVGAGTAGAFAGAMAARTMARSGLTTKLNSDANIDTVSLYDQDRMQGHIDQLTSEAYSVDELLSYVDDETNKMLYENNAKLMGGLAVGIAGGLLGNGAARGMGWLAGQYIDANFNVTAHAEGLHDGEVSHVIKNAYTPPSHVIDGSPQNAPSHVIDDLTPNHVIDGYESKTGSNHVIDGGVDENHPNHVIDGYTKPDHIANDTIPNHVIDGYSPKTKENAPSDTFYVESGHGFIREIQDYAKANGYGKISSAEAYGMHKLLLDEHGKNGLIDVHGIKKDTYVEDGDVRISASGNAHWRTGVEGDLESLMQQHDQGDKLSLHNASETTQTDNVIDGSADKNHPNHVIDGYELASKSSLSEATSVIDGTVETAQGQEVGNDAISVIDGTSSAASDRLSTTNSFTTKEFNGYGEDTKSYRRALAGVDSSHKADVLKAAAPEFQAFKLTEKVDGVWRFREVSSLPPKAADIIQRIANKNHWTLAA